MRTPKDLVHGHSTIINLTYCNRLPQDQIECALVFGGLALLQISEGTKFLVERNVELCGSDSFGRKDVVLAELLQPFPASGLICLSSESNASKSVDGLVVTK